MSPSTVDVSKHKQTQELPGRDREYFSTEPLNHQYHHIQKQLDRIN